MMIKDLDLTLGGLSVILLLCIGFLSPLQAQGIESGAQSQVRDREAFVSADFVDARSGPAVAYASRGRLYKDERVMLRGETGKEWALVVSGKVRGWVPLTAFRFPRTESNQSDITPERRRRLSDFDYTESGRRTHRGDASGSGEGTLTQVDVHHDTSTESLLGLRMAFSLGYGVIGREFESNAVEASVLRQFVMQPSALVSRLSVRWQPSSFIELTVDGRDLRLASIPIDYGADFDGEVSVSADAQDLEMTVGFAQRWSFIHGSVYGSAGWYRQAYQEVEPLTLALSTTSISLGGGVRIAWVSDHTEWMANAGLSKALSIDQEPFSSGEGTALLYRLSTQFVWWFSRGLGASIHLETHGRTTEYSGESTHKNISLMMGNQNYNRAREKDVIWSSTLGLIWRL